MKKISSKQLAQAVTALKQGGVVLLPTESSYGLCTPIKSVRGVNQILRLKQRTNRHFTAIAGSLAQVQEFFPRTRSAGFQQMASQVWPGPVSLVVTPKPRLAIRVPAIPWLRRLALAVGQPLIVTSANLSGHPSTFSVFQARQDLGLDQKPDQTPGVDYSINGGRLPKRPPSAVVWVRHDGWKILRSGSARVNRLLKQLQKESVPRHVHPQL